LAQGNLQNALESINAGLSTRQESGWQMFQPYHLATVAEVLCCGGEEQRALSALREAQAMIDTNTERWWEAETWRLKGMLLMSRRNLAEAESCFHEALKISRWQQAKSLELRAAMSLAKLWTDQGRRAEAAEMLAPIYGWFTEGFETEDLKEARALLDALTGSEFRWSLSDAGPVHYSKSPVPEPTCNVSGRA